MRGAERILALALMLTLLLLPAASSQEVVMERVWASPDMGGEVLAVAWSPDGGRLAVTGKFGELVVYDVYGSSLAHSFSSRLGFENPKGLSWSPDGSYIALGAAGVRLAVVTSWSGSRVYVDKAESAVIEGYTTAWSPDGSLVAAAGDDFVALYRWRGEDTEPLWVSKLPGIRVYKIAFMGKYLVGAAAKREAKGRYRAVLVVADAETGKVRLYDYRYFGLPGDAYSWFWGLSVSPSGRYLALAVSLWRGGEWRGSLLVCELKNGVPAKLASTTTEKTIQSVEWLSDVALAVGETYGWLAVYVFSKGFLKLKMFPVKVGIGEVPYGHGLAYSPGTELLAVASQDRHAYVCKVNVPFISSVAEELEREAAEAQTPARTVTRTVTATVTVVSPVTTTVTKVLAKVVPVTKTVTMTATKTVTKTKLETTTKTITETKFLMLTQTVKEVVTKTATVTATTTKLQVISIPPKTITQTVVKTRTITKTVVSVSTVISEPSKLSLVVATLMLVTAAITARIVSR